MTGPEAPPESDLTPAPRVRWWSRHPVAAVALVCLALVTVWSVTATVSLARAYSELREARASLVTAEAQLRDADLAGAREALDDGTAAAAAASSRLHHPQLLPLRPLPIVGSNLAVARSLSDAVRDTGSAAVRLLDAAHTIVHDDRDAVVGEVSIAYLEELAPPLRELADAFTRATTEIAAHDPSGLVGPVRDARAQFLELAEPIVEDVAVAADAIGVMPAFLGADSPRTYLLGAASLSELRASGGLLGSWSVLTADEGHLDIGSFADIDALGDLERDVAPPYDGFPQRYVDRGGLRVWRNANLTPDFPTSAQVLLSMWEALGREPLDGVIVVDPVVYERLVQRAGPLQVGQITTLTSEDVLRFVALDAYAAFDDDDERKAVLGAVAGAAFAEVLQVLDDDDVPATVEMLLDLADGQHLRVFSTDEQVQAILEHAGFAAQIPSDDGEFAAVYVSNAAANKVDAFTERWIDHRVALRPDGATEAVVTVDFLNSAPRSGYPRHVLGPWTEVTEAGDNLSIVSFLCGYGCRIEVGDGMQDVGTELGRPGAEVNLLIPAGEERTLRFSGRTPDAWYQDGDQLVLPIHHHVQPTLFATPVRFRVAVPSGWQPVVAPEDAQLVDGELVWEAESSGRLSYEVRFVPDDTAPGDTERAPAELATVGT